MNERDWYNCGAKIGDLVQSAIDSKNFQQLNQAITDTINQTVDAVQDSLYRGTGRQEEQGSFSYRPTHREKGSAYQTARSRADVGDLLDVFARSAEPNRGRSAGKVNRSLKGIFSMVAGYGMAVVSGLSALVMMILRFATGINVFGFLMALFAVLAAVFAVAGAKGGGYRARLRQLSQYLKVMGDRDTVTLKELAAGSGKSVREVQKDLKAMISDGMFASEAYLDEEGTTLMTSHEAYRQYQETMSAYEQRRAEAQRSQEAQERRGAAGSAAGETAVSYDEETAGILREGREFIAHIHACNDRIPGEEISAKLDRLEQVVTRIFAQVEREPESAPDLHRMMSYYLPITRKLVDAYVELGDESIGGANIKKTRQEIEMSLDTINTAFETFLDSFYQDTAWDISSDISAMKTMMARDGLTGGDFARTKQVGGEIRQAEAEAAHGAAAVPYRGGAAAAMQEE